MTDDTDDPRLRAALLAMIEGCRATAVLHVAARLGIADLLRDRPQDVDQLAAATGAHGPSLLRLLQGLAVLGVLEEPEPGRFRLAPMGQLLLRDAPRSLRTAALRSGGEMEMRAWGNLFHSIKTGETAFEHVFGVGGFEYLARDPRASAAFNQAMVATTREVAPALLAAYDFSRFRKVVDVGGGSGAFMAAILQAHPATMRGIVFDTPAGVAGAAALLEEAGLADRCEVVAGDFFADQLPAGADCYVVKSVLDDWDDDRALAILQNCRRAVAEGGRMVVIAPVLPERAEPTESAHATVMFDLQMLVTSGGRERTQAQFAALFGRAGFRLAAVIPTAAAFPYHILDGVPV